MKHLWLLLFVIPLFAQNPCQFNRDEVTNADSLKIYDDNCRKYLLEKKTERNPCDQSVRDTLPLGTKERTEFDNNCIKYIRKFKPIELKIPKVGIERKRLIIKRRYLKEKIHAMKKREVGLMKGVKKERSLMKIVESIFVRRI